MGAIQSQGDEALQNGPVIFLLSVRLGHVTVYLTARNLLKAIQHMIKSEFYKSDQPVSQQPGPVACHACPHFLYIQV